MPKIIKSAIKVQDDRDQKLVDVTDEKWVDFYNSFFEDEGVSMFACILNGPDGIRKIDFELLSPKGFEAVNGYLDKIEKKKQEAAKAAPKAEAKKEESKAEFTEDEMFEEDED